MGIGVQEEGGTGVQEEEHGRDYFNYTFCTYYGPERKKSCTAQKKRREKKNNCRLPGAASKGRPPPVVRWGYVLEVAVLRTISWSRG